MNSNGYLPRKDRGQARPPNSDAAGRQWRHRWRCRLATTLGIAVAGLLAAAWHCHREDGPNDGRQSGEQTTASPHKELLKEPAFLPTATADDLKQEAIRAAKGVLETHPGDIDALQIAAGLHSRLGNSNEAVKIWRRCLEIDPECVAAYSSIGLAAQRAGDLEEAAGMFEKVILLEPSRLEASASLADVLLQLGKPEEVVETLQDRVRDEVVLDKALLILGQAYLQLEEYEKARETLQRLIGAAPQNGRAYYALARVYAKLGRNDESRQALEKFQSLSSLDHEARARDLREYVDLKTARNILIETLTASGRLYRDRRKPAAAEQAWRKVAVLDSANAACRYQLLYLYEEQSRDRDALAVSEELCEIEPENVQHWVNAGLLNARLDRFDAALAALQHASKLDPENLLCRQAYEIVQGGK